MDLLSALEHFIAEKADREAMDQAWELRFSEKMKEKRSQAQRQVQDVAKACGVSPGMIVQLEKGMKHWKLEVARKYLESCSVPAAAIH